MKDDRVKYGVDVNVMESGRYNVIAGIGRGWCYGLSVCSKIEKKTLENPHNKQIYQRAMQRIAGKSKELSFLLSRGFKENTYKLLNS